MLIYYILFIFIIIAGLLQFFKFKNSNKSKIIYISITGVFMFFISAFRYGIGFDFHAYFKFFTSCAKSSWQDLKRVPLDYGFAVFLKLISYITKNPQIVYIVTSALMISITMFIIYKFSKIPFVSILMYLGTNTFIMGMNNLRSSVSISISFLGIYFLKKSTLRFTKESFNIKNFFDDFIKNFLPYLFIVILAGMMHKAAFILIPVYYLVKIDLNTVTSFIYLIMATIYMLFSTPIFLFLSNTFFNGGYSSDSAFNSFATEGGTHFIYIHLFFLILIFVTQKRIKEKDSSNLSLINLSVYSSIIYIIAGMKTFIFTRISVYFSIYMILLLPEIINSLLPTTDEQLEVSRINEKSASNKKLSQNEKKMLSNNKDNKVFYKGAIFASIVLFVFMQTSAMTVREGGGAAAHGVFPYRSMFSSVDNFNSLNFNDNRELANQKLFVSRFEEDPNISTYLHLIDDPNYIVFLSFDGDGTNLMYQSYEDVSVYFDWIQKQYEALGFETNFNEMRNKSFVGISNGGEKILEISSDEPIEQTLNVDGLEINIASSGHITGDNLSRIVIENTSYHTAEGINIVVYDKVLKKVVDSVNFSNFYYRLAARRYEDNK